MNSFALGRLILFSILVPLAIILGYLLASPESLTTFAVVGLVLGLLLLPAVLKWHHVLLIVGWNASINIFFLPGRPQFWLLMAVVSLGIALIRRAMVPNVRFLSAPGVSWSLLAILAVVLITAQARGGIGVRALGGDAQGGKGYFYVIGAILGYFAMTAQGIPKRKIYWLAGAFFLASITAVISNLAYFGGPPFYFLYLLFPVENAISQAAADFGGPFVIQRLGGFSALATGVTFFLLARYGLKGTFTMAHPWRWILFITAMGLGTLSGFRSVILFVGLTSAVLFYLEGLHKTKAVAWTVGILLLGGALLVPIAPKLPLAAQRTLSFLPLPIDEMAKQDASGSSEWRVQMWDMLVAQIPDYLWLGKGYVLDPTAFYLAEQASLRGMAKGYEVALLAGDYHSGPLSLIIPFGIWGVLAFLGFLICGGRVLYANYRYGDPYLKPLNTFLLGLFAVRVFYFFVVFGAFNSELFLFTGILGLSVAANGGVAKRRKVVTRNVSAIESPKPRELASATA